MRTTSTPASIRFPALGTTAVLLVADPEPAAVEAARRVLEDELAAIDLACSRFRPDSELSRANAAAGGPGRTVGPLFAEALETAFRAAELTEGVVDPTVGSAVSALGYDRTFASVRPEDVRPAVVTRPAGWRSVRWNPAARRLGLPAGVGLDLGATAKALCADRAARRAAQTCGRGVLIGLGGDLSAAGEPPPGGWQVEVADVHSAPSRPDAPVVSVRGGGLATSGTTARTWRRGGRVLHHIVDPATGDVPPPFWRTVSVAAADCVEANTEATAAVVLGRAAPDRLRRRGLPARLVRVDGSVLTLGGWPPDRPAGAGPGA